MAQVQASKSEQNSTTIDKKQKPNFKYIRDKNRQMVKGIFRFYEVPGGVLEFIFKEFKEDEVEKFTLVDGQVHSIPLGVALHLNKNGRYPVHVYAQDESGAHSQKIGKKIARFGFQSLEFIDIPELSDELVTVEMTGL